MTEPAGRPQARRRLAAEVALKTRFQLVDQLHHQQNAGEELNWRPTKEWNFTAAGGWEGYNYTEADAGYTNEYSVKGSVDWKPFSWLTARASGFYSDRTAGNYNYLNNVAMFQYPVIRNYTAQCAVITSGCGGWVYSTAYQQLMFDNRQRTKADSVVCRGSWCYRHAHLQIQGRLLSAQYRHWRTSELACGRFKPTKSCSAAASTCAWVVTPGYRSWRPTTTNTIISSCIGRK